jgi:dTDP-4-amino-4,6-dideoxygalactose transaminase
LAQGPEVAALEAAFGSAHNVAHAVAVTNGTAALHVALIAAGVQPGDEVLVPAFTFAASANAVLAIGARPVFVDIDDDFLLDLDDAAKKISESTTAVMPVHLYGLMVDMDSLLSFVANHGLAAIEDSAQAHLARRAGRYAGSAGVGAFSFYATKNMMSGEGGMVTTNDVDIAERARRFRNHGMVNRYEHIEWGLNYRLSDLHAAIARVQLDSLPAATKQRRTNAAIFDDGLSDFFRKPQVPDGAYHVFHQYTVRVPAVLRDDVVERFRAASIGVDVYYPTPLTQQPAFRDLGDPASCPAAARAAEEVISLPVHPAVDQQAAERIVGVANTIADDLA